MLVDMTKIAVTMLVLDFIWISIVAGNQFKKMTESIQGSEMIVRPLGAFVAYSAMIMLFYTFVRKDDPDWKAFLLGALAYALYDGTNYALFSKWELKTAIADVLWGGTLFYLTKKIAYA